MHAHAAAAQADMRRAEAQGRRQTVPPAHVEGRRSSAQGFGAAALWPLLDGMLAIAAIGAGIGLALLVV